MTIELNCAERNSVEWLKMQRSDALIDLEVTDDRDELLLLEDGLHHINTLLAIIDTAQG